jgi:hypothetical protein
MIIQARRELLEVNASMEALAGSGTAHQVGAALQVLSLSLLPLHTHSVFRSLIPVLPLAY